MFSALKLQHRATTAPPHYSTTAPQSDFVRDVSVWHAIRVCEVAGGVRGDER